ncbi:hypothetical protein BKA56DRAFT_700497, partial [Ilyonectria sp. MPI-CAGE-AT-0026]
TRSSNAFLLFPTGKILQKRVEGKGKEDLRHYGRMGKIFNYSHGAKGRRREKGQISHQFSGLARPSGRVRRASQTRQTCQMGPKFPS